MDVFPETFAVAGFVEDAAAAVGSLVRRKGNVLMLDLGEELGAMRSDIVKLRQCLFNLLSNAAKFTEGGQITLRVRRETGEGGDWLSFAVEDTGIGMSADQLGRLFQRFSQADESTTRRFGGTGLGLLPQPGLRAPAGPAISGWRAREGRGTVFTLRVPARSGAGRDGARGVRRRLTGARGMQSAADLGTDRLIAPRLGAARAHQKSGCGRGRRA